MDPLGSPRAEALDLAMERRIIEVVMLLTMDLSSYGG